MGIPVLIIGRSGTGKTTSLRNIKNAVVFNILNKTLPFQVKVENNLAIVKTPDYQKIKSVLIRATAAEGYLGIIDDAGYLMTDAFMNGHSSSAKGNAVFELYNQIADNFYDLVKAVGLLDDNVIVYFLMHEDQNDFGNIKPKTIGKMLDDKVCLEGMFTICLRTVIQDKKYVFATKTDGLDVVKTPLGLFDEDYIDNDLAVVDAKIRKFYNLKESKLLKKGE